MGLFIVIISGSIGVALGGIFQSEMVGAIEPDVVPGLLLALVLLGTALSGFEQALRALYLSDDLEKLLVAPIPARSVVTAKLLGRLPTVMFFLLALAMPAMISWLAGRVMTGCCSATTRMTI